MARLEIEIAGVNADLKRVLKDSKIALSNFTKGLDFKPTGVNSLNASLTQTKTLLKDINSLAANIRGAIGNRGLFESPTAELNAARLASENYRTETARLASELQALRLQTAQSRTATTAATGSYREAQQQLTALGRSIREAAGGFNSTNPAIQGQIRQYRTLNERLRAFDATMGNHQRSIGNYQRALQGLGGLAATYFGFTALLAAGRTVIKNNAEISDSLADVRRTAGLSAKEATQLGAALKNIDTRTSLKDLLGISTIGGQLGIAKDQLAGFTKAVDQLSVSLGGELKGGAAEIAKSLGVLDNVFKISTANGGNVEKAYNQIGSAILQLGQSGLATGDFLADFGERVGGIARQAGIALPTVLSFGAVLQENGVSAEVAGTGFKRLINAISSNSGKFFEVAKFADVNLTLDEFNRIVNTDTKKALELFFTGLSKGGKSTVAFNSILKTLKLSGTGVSQVVAAISADLPGLNNHIEESTKALEAGTLAADQFAIKNNTLGASLDKLGNAFTNISTNPDSNLGNLFKGLIDSITGGIKVIDILLGKLKEVQYDSAIDRFNKKGDTGNIFIGANDVKAEKARREEAKQAGFRNNANKVAARLTSDAILDIQAESNAKTILIRTNERLAVEEKKLADIRAGYSKATTSTTKDELGKQLLAQREFVRLLKLEAASLVPRSNAKTPTGFVVGGKKSGAGTSSQGTTSSDILAKSVASSAIADEEPGVAKLLERLKQRYIGYYDDLDKLALKKGADRTRIEADRAKIQANETKERGAIELSEAQRVASERQRILDAAGVKSAESIQKELKDIDARYNQEIDKAKGNASILAAIAEGKEAEINKVYADYAQKRIDAEQKITDKINDIVEKGFTENLNRTIKGSNRIDEQLKDRLSKLRDYFNELRKMSTDPLITLGLGVAENVIGAQVKGQADAANNPEKSYGQLAQEAKNLLSNALQGFSTDFISTLRNINQQADKSFGAIIGNIGISLSDQLNDIFGSQLKSILGNLISNTKISITDAIGAIAGLAGNLISGLTKKTSTVGQAAGGALSGAATGAIAGSVLGPGGTLIGGVIGGIAGLLGGIFGSKKARKEEAIRQAELEEQKKQTKLLERANALAYQASIIGQQTNQGLVTGVERDAQGNLVATIAGKDILITMQRAQKDQARGIL